MPCRQVQLRARSGGRKTHQISRGCRSPRRTLPQEPLSAPKRTRPRRLHGIGRHKLPADGCPSDTLRTEAEESDAAQEAERSCCKSQFDPVTVLTTVPSASLLKHEAKAKKDGIRLVVTERDQLIRQQQSV